MEYIFRSNLGLPQAYNDWTLCKTQDTEDTKELLVILFYSLVPRLPRFSVLQTGAVNEATVL